MFKTDNGLKRVLYVGSNGFPYGSAMIQRQIQLSKLLLEIGFNVTIINRRGSHSKTIKKREGIFNYGDYQGIKYIYASLIPFKPLNFFVRNTAKIIGYIFEFFIIFYYAFFKNAQYIFSNTISLSNIKYYWFLSRIFKMELVYDYVEYIDSLGNRNKKEIIEINKSFDNNFYKYTDRIICISDYLKNQVKNSNHGKLVFKIPPIIDFSFFDSVKIESRNPSNFLFCGSAAYFDIIVFIINSFFYSEAVKNNYQLKLIINGASSQILRINEFVDKKKNRNNITILSKLSYIDLIRYYKSATALLIPISNNLQDKARFPFKICEYTASKRPIITSDTGAIEEFFKDNKTAFIAKADDYESFADKMNLVINEPGFANEIGANGYNLGKKVFNYKAYAEEFKKFLVKKQL